MMTTDVAPDRFIVSCDRVLDSYDEPLVFSYEYLGVTLRCATKSLVVTRTELGRYETSKPFADAQELFHLLIHEVYGWSYEYRHSTLPHADGRYRYTCPSCTHKILHPY